MQYAVIATLGPATHDARAWEDLLAAGATAFRLNTSHIAVNDLLGWLARLEVFFHTRPAREPVEVVLDLQGSKWRLGVLPARELIVGERVRLVLADALDPGDSALSGAIPVPRADFFRAAPLSDGEVVLNDAKVRLRIERIEGGVVHARVTQGGPVAARKGITLPGSSVRSEALCEKDREIVERTRAWGFTSCAVSYVKDALEMRRYREIFAALPDPTPKIIAKLERAQAMLEAAAIAQHANEVWVCRGDLGAEMGLPAMAKAVRRLAEHRADIPAPVIMAGQVLEHMTISPTPTRSEVCYLYDCLDWGCDGFVLSDEAAVGRYPVESCRTAAMFRQTGAETE